MFYGAIKSLNICCALYIIWLNLRFLLYSAFVTTIGTAIIKNVHGRTQVTLGRFIWFENAALLLVYEPHAMVLRIAVKPVFLITGYNIRRRPNVYCCG